MARIDWTPATVSARAAASGNHRLPSAAPGINSVRFGDGRPDRVTIRKVQPPLAPQKKHHLLLPPGTPMFFLHGLSTTGESFTEMTHWVTTAQETFPVYVSFIPEAADGRPIENPKNPADIPTAGLALHDLGSFRCQNVYQNLKQLTQMLEEAANLPPAERQQAIADYFGVLPEYRNAIVPIIEHFILYPSFQIPAELRKHGHRESLYTMSEQGSHKIHRELVKVLPAKQVDNIPIVDTTTLHHYAQAANKKINADPHTHYDGKRTVNLRPLRFQDIAGLESYLMVVEEQLTQALVPVMGTPERASLTSKKLMEKIAPRGMTLGYSQGGCIMMAALLRYLDEGPRHSGELRNIANRPEVLAGRYIGLGTFFSSPLQGTSRRPRFAVRLFEEINTMMGNKPVMKKASDHVESFLDWYLWRQKIKNQPSLAEMLEDGAVSRRTRAFLNHDKSLGHATIDDTRGMTLLSAADQGDTYVNPESSKLRDEKGQSPTNVFNIDVEAFDLPENTPDLITSPDKLIENTMNIFGKYAVTLVKKLPQEYKQAYFDHFGPIYNQAVRHWALMTNTNQVFDDIGRKILTDTKNQINLLDTGNFEPLRLQSLVARTKVYQRDILSRPTPEAAQRLAMFFRHYPTFVHALIENAQEALPVENSASFQASLILDNTLTLVENILEDPDLRPKYNQSMRNALTTLAQADLKPYAASQGLAEEGLSARAQSLLDRFY